MVALDGLIVTFFLIIVIAMETAEISTLRLPLTRRRIYALVLVKRTLSPVGATGVTVRLDLERQVTTRRSYDQAYAQLVQPAPDHGEKTKIQNHKF